jgi:uncharacterized membrane protein YecN with MAPEG domain
MLTGKTLLAFAIGVVITIGAVLHYHGPDAMRALGRLLHGGQ